jgi:hypothetical protein
LIIESEMRAIPLQDQRSNTLTQMEDFLADAFGLEEAAGPNDPFDYAIHEAEQAIQQLRVGGLRLVNLTPANSHVRRTQHEMAREANLISHSYGQEPRRYVRIYRDARHR